MILTSGFSPEAGQSWVEKDSKLFLKSEYNYPHEDGSVALLLTGLRIVKYTHNRQAESVKSWKMQQ